MTEFTNNYFRALKDSDEQRIGYWYACRAWKDSVSSKTNYFMFDEWIQDKKDIADFIECLKAAGVVEFALANHSTALMDTLHAFVENGCTIKGLCKVDYCNSWNDRPDTKNGILLSL